MAAVRGTHKDRVTLTGLIKRYKADPDVREQGQRPSY